MVHYHLLVTHWISIWYTILSYWPTGYIYDTLPSPFGLLVISMVYYPSLTGPLDITLVYHYLLLTHWISLWYTTLSYWPTGYPYATLLSSTGPLDTSVVNYPLLLAYFYPYVTLLSSTSHWISLWFIIISYLPTSNPYVTLLSSTGPLDISMVHSLFSIGPLSIPMLHCYFLLAN